MINELVRGTEHRCVFKRIKRDYGSTLLVIYNFGQQVDPLTDLRLEVERKFRTSQLLQAINETDFTDNDLDQVLDLDNWHSVHSIQESGEKLFVVGIVSTLLIDHNGRRINESAYLEHLKSCCIFDDVPRR